MPINDGDYETSLKDLQDILRQVEQAKHLPGADRVRLMNKLFTEFLHQRGRLPPGFPKPKEH